MDVSVCVPVFNEKLALRKTILELMDAFDRLPYKYEIIVIDDGSSDGCLSEIHGLNVRVIRHKRNMGGGVARVTGMRYAKGRIIFQTDADGTYPCDKIQQILERMRNADMVVAARNRESATDWRYVRAGFKWFLKFLAGILAGIKIPDLNSGMRAYDRRLALRYAYLYPKGHSIMSTMTLAFLSEGLRVDFVDIEYRVRMGKSTFRPLADTYNYLVTIIRTIVYFDPLRILMPVTGFFALVAIIFTFRDLLLFSRINNVTTTSWIMALFVLILGILSDQLSRLARQIAHATNVDLQDDDMIEEIVL
jgi:polyisoprenyl-phosphate glycosyltransferase